MSSQSTSSQRSWLVPWPFSTMSHHAEKHETYLRYIDEFVGLSSAPTMLEVFASGKRRQGASATPRVSIFVSLMPTVASHSNQIVVVCR